MSFRRPLRFAALVVYLAGLVAAPVAAQISVVQAERIASGLSSPIFASSPPADASRLFIVEQHSGQVRILDRLTSTILATPFLTVGGVSTGGEQGLLGMAFHPDYASNGYFYVYFTDSGGDTVIRRYQVSGDPNLANAGSGLQVLTISQPQSNHNGGWIGFGPDGFLYIGSGDGGAGNDSGSGHTEPGGNSQDLTSNLLGKLLRVDVDGDDFGADPDRNYAIPPSNPFVGISGDDEIWAYGLRNPWRASFDRLSGDLYIGDVGQNAREEIDFQPAASGGGENYGWRLREGMIQTPGGVGGAKPGGAIDPIYNYSHGSGTTQGYSVTGGYVYRGPVTALQGYYLFADYVTQRIWMLEFDGAAPASHNGTNYTNFTDITAAILTDAGTIGNVSSFGEDADGNVFIVDHDGEIFEIVGASPGVITDVGDGDPYKLYKTKRSSGAPRTYSFGPVTLTDLFRSANYDIKKQITLGTAVDKNGVAAHDPDTHLVEYTVRSKAGSVATSLLLGNQCDIIAVTMTNAVSLLVPANFDSVVIPAPPDAGSHDVDHFLCYKARTSAALAKGTQVDLVDGFDGAASRRYELTRVNKFCTPVDKSGTPALLAGPNKGQAKAITPATRKDPTEHLLCYKAKLAKNTIVQDGCGAATPGDSGTPIEPPPTRHTQVIAAQTSDQFGSLAINTVKEVEVCLPTLNLTP